MDTWGFPDSSVGKESACNAGDPWVGKIPWRSNRLPTAVFLGFPGGLDGKEPACNAGDPWVGKIPWRRDRLPTAVFLGFPGDSASKEFACNAGDPSLIPGSGRSPGEAIGYPLQYSWASLVAQLVKNPPTMWVDLGSIPGLGRSAGEGYPLQYSGLENSMDCI